MKTYYTKITGFASSVPKASIDNEAFKNIIDTSDEWIVSRTGIKKRRIAGDDEGSVSFAIEASKKAIEHAGIHSLDIDLIICASSLPDYLYPSNACFVQGAIGAKNAVAFDVVAACSGFVYVMKIAQNFIQNGSYKKVLIIGSDVHSRMVNWEDRSTCVLFGDGAGAMILEASSDKDQNDIYRIDINSDGSKSHELYLLARRENPPFFDDSHKIVNKPMYMNGKEIYKFSVKLIPKAIIKTLSSAKMSIEDINYFIPHQANLRIVEAIARELKVEQDRMITEIRDFGNTSSASIAIALDYATSKGKITFPSNAVIVGFGAGLTWGVGVIRLRCFKKNIL